jgi:hypothetical protein
MEKKEETQAVASPILWQEKGVQLAEANKIIK